MKLIAWNLYFLFIFLISGCTLPPIEEKPPVVHTYSIVVTDVDDSLMSDVSVKYQISSLDTIIKDTTVQTSKNGRIEALIQARTFDVNSYIKYYKSEISYEVTKAGYYYKKGKEKLDTRESATKVVELRLEKPTDYLSNSFLSSNYDIKLKEKIVGLILFFQAEALLVDSYLSTRSIDVVRFKEQNYLSITLKTTDVYNSLKANKYDICKILFDEVAKKMLTFLNENFQENTELFGYDITVIGFTRSFANKFEENKKIVFRYLIPREHVIKYKNKDVSSQQLLDSSIILMDDERIELKLQ
ncbi:MAG: hypothetical protein FMNOHCHN_03334 [Ignavibacteriaceae bacterium]|nr:hypothetical protein [Ignavibacteriaceae bacterium]